LDFRIVFRRTESHDDIGRLNNRFEPGPEQNGNVESRQGTLSDDHRVNEFHRDVLGVGSVRPFSKRQKTAAFEETIRHLPASESQTLRFPREEFLANSIPLQKSVLDVAGELWWGVD
jgi:hypothetical protein